MNITSAKYVQSLSKTNINVKATIDGKEMFVPIDENNRHYAEILKLINAGTLTIEEAD
tara:strand:+ start:392 stop:565 length:174 start_codon:yes stop_codon:yes gene_type:complete